jgi:hypothetical protein
MAATQLRTVSQTLPRTPEREALANKIAEHAKAALQPARLKAAIEHTNDLLYGDEGAIRAAEKAKAALEEAEANEGHHLAAVALGEATTDGDPVMIATAAVKNATAHVDSTRKIRAALEEQLKVAESELQSTKSELDAAIGTVLRDEASGTVDKILIEAAALQEQLGAKRAELSFLQNECFEWNAEQRLRIREFLAAPAYPWEFNRKTREHPALEPWRQACEALRHDADAPLPI